MFSTSKGLSAASAQSGQWQKAMRAFTSKGALAVTDQAIVSITNFVWVREIGRACSLGQLGDYYQAMTILFVLMNVQSELITAPYTVYCHRKSGRSLDDYTGSVFAHQFIASIVAVLALLVFFALTPLPAIGTTLTLSALTLVFAGPFWLMRGFLRYISFARMQCGAAVVMDFAASVLQLTGLWLLLQYGEFRIHWAFAIMGGSSAIVVGGWFWFRPIPLMRPKSLAPAWRENWPFAKWALLSQMVGGLTPNVFPWLLKSLKGRAAAGVLGAANTLCGVAVMFTLGIAHLLTPAASRAYVDGGKQALIRMLLGTATFLFCTVGFFALVSLFFGEYVMTLVYDDRFAGHSDILAVLAFAVLINCVSITCGNGLWAIDKPQLNLFADAAVLVSTVTAAILLVPRHGPMGAAWATLIGNSFGSVTRFAVLWFGLRSLPSMHVATPEAAS